MIRRLLTALAALAAVWAIHAQDTLRIATYNVWEGLEDDPSRMALFQQWADSVSPDVLMLDELVGFTPAKLQAFAERCGYPYSSLLKEEWYPVGVISKTPIETVHRYITPMDIVLGQKRGLWHGMLHARTAGIDLLITHLAPFDYKFRRQEADTIVAYAQRLGLKDYLVAGDLNSISPYDADRMLSHPGFLKRQAAGDAKRPDWNNLNEDGMFDTAVISKFLASGLSDPLWRYVRDPFMRATHPTCFARKLPPGSPKYDNLSMHIDYVLLSPSLMSQCTDAHVDRVEGVSDHYPVVVTLVKKTYKDPSLSPEARVADLLPRMNVHEKMAQLRHLHSGDLFDGQEFNERRLTDISGDVAYGFVEGFPLTSDNMHRNMAALQRHMVEDTRLGIPAFIVAESLHGSVHEGSTIFPQNIALASTFHPTLARERAHATAADLHYQGANQVLAPNLDVVRDLRWGRVEETYGEDPMLASIMGRQEVAGYIESGISPMLKHFGPHANPLGGLNLASVHGGESELHDIYLKPFRDVVTSLPVMAVMSTYNSWNRVPNSASHHILTEILRDRWGFPGYVYADWGAVRMLETFHHTAADKDEAALQALNAGLDVEASSDCFTAIPSLVADSLLDPAVLDRAVARVLLAKFRAGLFDDPYGQRYRNRAELHSTASQLLAKTIADESAVLLKNDGALLPLDRATLHSVAVIGPNADQVQFGDYSWSRDNAHGITPLQGLRALLGPDVEVNYAKGCDLMSLDTAGIPAAVEAARRSQVAIVFAGSASASLARDYSGSNCGEGFDTPDLELTGAQSQLIRSVAATGTPVVLVLVTGKAYAIPWEKDNIPAIVMQWYAGERGGESIADILLGRTNPSGHLPVSIARSAGHLPAYYNHLPTDKGYYRSPGSYGRPGRDYVFSSPDPLWAFGHGLSYTTFTLGGLTASIEGDSVRASVDVTNTGVRPGMAVPQLYVRDAVSSIATPVKQLKAFGKVALEPGETRRVKLDFPVDELSFTDASGRRVLEPGDFEIMAGQASDAIEHTATVTYGTPRPLHSTAAKAVAQYKGTGRDMRVTGVVRDVQANPVKGVKVRSGRRGKVLATTGADGSYALSAPDNDTLTFEAPTYIPQPVGVQGRASIHVTLSK